MKQQNKYCTREQAFKLKHLGIYQGPRTDGRWWFSNYPDLMHAPDTSRNHMGESAAAFDVAELGEMMGDDNFTFKNNSQWAFSSMNDDFNVGFYDTEAEARATMLIWLIENNILTVQSINKTIQSL